MKKFPPDSSKRSAGAVVLVIDFDDGFDPHGPERDGPPNDRVRAARIHGGISRPEHLNQ